MAWDDGESLGIPTTDPGMSRRRGLWSTLANLAMGTQQEEIPQGMTARPASTWTSPGPTLRDRVTDDPTTRANHEMTGEAYGEGQRQAPVRQSSGQRAPGFEMPTNAMPDLGGGMPPDHMAQLQDQYDRLNPTPQPMSLKQKLLRGGLGALTGVLAGPQGMQQIEKNRQFQQNQNREKSQNLLQQIEAERRMQEQERLGTQRMTLQEQMQAERERTAQASQERVFGQQNQLEATREAARQATLKQQMDEQNQRQQAQFQQQQDQQSRQFGEQEKLEGMREAAAERREKASAGLKDQATTAKRYETAMDADQRLGRMEAAYGKGVKGDQQAMLSLLADHLGMTMGMQKGARITKDILQEAQQSQPWLAKIGAKFDSRGYLSGVALGPDQMRQMLDLGYEARDRAVQGAYDDSQLYGVEPPKGAGAVFGKRKMGEKPALQGGGQGGGKGALSLDEARQYLQRAGGDKDKARALARQEGRSF